MHSRFTPFPNPFCRLALATLLAACGGAGGGQAKPGLSPRDPKGTSTPALTVSRAAFRNGTRSSVTTFATFAPDGTIYAGHSGSSITSGTVDALGPTGETFGSVSLTFAPKLGAASADRVLVSGQGMSPTGEISHRLALVSRTEPRILAEARADALLGATCLPTSIATAPEGFVVMASCSGKFVRYGLSSDLRVLSRFAMTGSSSALAPDILVSVGDLKNDITVTLSRWSTRVPGSTEGFFSSRLYAAPAGRRLRPQSFLQPIALADGDLVAPFAIHVPELLPNGMERSRGTGVTFIDRIGRTPFHVELFREEGAESVPRIFAVKVLDSSLFAAIYYVQNPRIGGVVMPKIADPDDPDEGFSQRVAVVELDAKRGEVRAVTAIRSEPSEGPLGGFDVSTGQFLFLHAGTLEVYSRAGTPVRSAERTPVAAPIAPPPLFESAPAPALLRERWSEICGVRWASKGNAPCRVEHVAVGPGGAVAISGGYYQDNQLGSRKMSRRAYETALVAGYGPTGQPTFLRSMGASWHNEVSSLVYRDDGRIVAVGSHGNQFTIDGATLPRREVPKVSGQDMEFEANTGFAAIFDGTGKALRVTDLDPLVFGDTSPSYTRACSAKAYRSTAPNDAWLHVECGTKDPGGSASVRTAFRAHAAGEDFTGVEAIPPTRFPTLLDEQGSNLRLAADFYERRLLFGSSDRVGTRFLEPMTTPMFAGYAHLAARRRAFYAESLAEQDDRAAGRPHLERLIVATGSRDSGVVARTLALSGANDTRIDGITEDDLGRPIVSIRFSAPLVIGNQRIEPLRPDPKAPLLGRVFVRLVPDLSKIDAILVPTPRGCSYPSHGDLTSMDAHAGLLAITYRFGMSPACGVKDEGSTVMTFDAP